MVTPGDDGRQRVRVRASDGDCRQPNSASVQFADDANASNSYWSGCRSMFQDTSQSGSAPGSPHTSKP